MWLDLLYVLKSQCRQLWHLYKETQIEFNVNTIQRGNMADSLQVYILTYLSYFLVQFKCVHHDRDLLNF